MYQEVSLWLIVTLVFLCAGVPLLYSLIYQGSWCRIFSSLLIAQIIPPLPDVQSDRQGVPRFVGPHHLDLVLLEVNLIDCAISGENMLQYAECRHLSKTHQLVHQWGQEDWFHRRDDLLLQSSVHSGVLAK